ncbi:hypothetical protein EII12_10875 [Buchananella hordeovulneris]|uniref:WXG100 family type VII secretion target n=1 Tax=Buchananella hordeovulneris TaxID=52770 RepID=A0A1Q5PT63_9ACTO|nr:hypothetical protein [Buchananella hordeovulneris]OKL50716.1 hypothetical protein BSZ40_11070 [Buchananella hordeovulneris]RRD48958.1 hypothetical protein EII12_10875 [Buchananella hordeovulneris]
MTNEDLSFDYDQALHQCNKLEQDGKASLEASIAATEAWADQQTVERWGTEPGAIRFRTAYRNFILALTHELRINAAELDEFTARLRAAIHEFKDNEEQLEQAVKNIVDDIGAKSQYHSFLPVAEVANMGSSMLPPNMRME